MIINPTAIKPFNVLCFIIFIFRFDLATKLNKYFCVVNNFYLQIKRNIVFYKEYKSNKLYHYSKKARSHHTSQKLNLKKIHKLKSPQDSQLDI